MILTGVVCRGALRGSRRDLARGSGGGGVGGVSEFGTAWDIGIDCMAVYSVSIATIFLKSIIIVPI